MPIFPRYVLIQTTSACNARCMICPYKDTYATMPQGVMDDALFARIVDELARHNEVFQVMPYLMNEPLLDAKLPARIAYIRQAMPHVCIHIVTNGMMLDDTLTHQLITSGLSSIKISMLGHRKETYERVMGSKAYDIAFPRIERFVARARQERGKDFVSVCLTNTPGYVSPEEVDEARSFWQSRDIRYEFIDYPISRAGNVPMLKAPRHTHMTRCRSMWRDEMIHILFNGDVIVCCMDWQREVVLGNLRTQSIAEIWHGQTYAEVRSIIAGTATGAHDFLCYRCEEAVRG